MRVYENVVEKHSRGYRIRVWCGRESDGPVVSVHEQDLATAVRTVFGDLFGATDSIMLASEADIAARIEEALVARSVTVKAIEVTQGGLGSKIYPET